MRDALALMLDRAPQCEFCATCPRCLGSAGRGSSGDVLAVRLGQFGLKSQRNRVAKYIIERRRDLGGVFLGAREAFVGLG